jgi:hypothetical protein
MNQAYRSHLSGDRVRLLFLLPGITGERIKCQTKEVSLSESPQYSAVSYMWGLPGLHSYDIILNDQYFRVQRNLRLVLDCLRLPDEIRILWVDAICIYSHRTATKHLRSLRIAPQFSEGFNFTHLVSQTWQYKFPYSKPVHLANSST